jgi:23S rRNA (guanosine2251-2'-O)-methyltransferase
MPERIEGRNAVREALKAGRALEKLYVQKGVSDAVIREITAGAAEQGIRPFLTEKEKLDALSQTGRHQGVIAEIAAYEYAEVSDILKAAAEKGEDPFILLLDGIEDPHNLGAILRSAHLAGAHGVIIPKNRAAGLNATVAKVSAGAVNYIHVARVTNLSRTMEELKQKGLWFVCADMDGEVMYRQNLTGPIGLVIGSEGDGVSALVRKHCDFITRIPMSGQIDSLNASVAAGILAFEVVRQRKYRK